jgi:arylsulfatase A-like enzyme
MYLWRGLDAKSVGQGSDARIIDVAPTLLAMLDVPIPDWMDGSPMAGVVNTHRLRSGLGLGSDESNRPPAYAPYTDEQRAAVEDRLEALGYIE